MSTFARDRRSPLRGSLAEFAVGRPQRRAFDLIQNLEVLRRAPVRSADLPPTRFELHAAETLMAIARAMAPTLDEVREIAARHGITGSDPELLRNVAVANLVAERFPYRQPDRAACRAYYDAHPQEFRGPDLYEGGEILVGGDVTDREWRGEAYGRADYAYHLPAITYAAGLKSVAQRIGIAARTASHIAIERGEDGAITALVADGERVPGDFFVDTTGGDAALIGRTLASVLAGGALPHATLVAEQHLLDLEREAFLKLCGERKTLERIQYTLKTGKPLRN